MARWSSVEKSVGTLSAKWPKKDDLPSYWTVLHDSVDTLRGLMQVLDDAFEAIDNNPDLSSSGRSKKRIEEATSVLKELEKYEPLEKASNLVARKVAKLHEKMSVLPESPSGADIAIAAEIRAAIKAESEPEKFAFGLRSDAKVVRAILSAPAFLSGMTDEGLGRLREAALHALHPAEVSEVAELTAAEKIARDALALAKERIATRAGLTKGADGTWTAPDAKATT
jgi:hypothetical protein